MLIPSQDKDRYDLIVYEEYLRYGPMRIAKTFGEYRQLKLALEAYHVFSLEQKNAATELALKNSTSNHNTSSSSGKVGDGSDGSSGNSSVSPRRVIVVEAPFPKTYKRSTLGIQLKESQLKRR